MNKTAIIGGTGLETLSTQYTVTAQTVKTRFGVTELLEVPELGLFFLSRHGKSHTIAPHEINYRANIQALKDLGIERLLAPNAVGSLRLDLPPDSLVLIDDFLDMTRARPLSLFDEPESGVRHTDFSQPYCPELRDILLETAAEMDLSLLPRGTYVCADGPRFESPAEVRMYAQLGGDVVGMTGLPEAVFAREAGICYAAVAIVTNHAAGLTDDPVDHAEVVAAVFRSAERIRDLFLTAAPRIPLTRSCPCPTSVSTQP